MKEIPLTQGMFAQVDDDWYEYLMQWKWHYLKDSKNNTGYAVRNDGKWPHRKLIHMHRVIMNTPNGVEVNHIDFNGCNNQTANLENVTKTENSQHSLMQKNNTSGYIGVRKHGNKWQAQLHQNRKCRYLGTFNTPQEAGRAYDTAALQHFGLRAILNFSEEHKNEIHIQ